MQAAALGSAFTFQGNLTQAGVPFDGTADFDFTVWDAVVLGNQIGSTVTLLGVTVTGPDPCGRPTPPHARALPARSVIGYTTHGTAGWR